MTTIEARGETATRPTTPAAIPLKLEVIVLPVADVEVRLGSEAHRQLVDELVADRRNDLAALPGEVLLRHRGKIVRLVNDGGGSR